MARYYTYVCAPFCIVNCKHGLPCECMSSKHPTDRGFEHHFAVDSKTDKLHSWHGKAGKCKIETLVDTEKRMNLDEYRIAVIAAVDCPFCGSPQNAKCYKVENPSEGVSEVTNEEVYYVHDDRSALFHDKIFYRRL